VTEHEMLDLCAQNLLEADPRPTFVIELQGGDVADEFAISYSNKSFKSRYEGIVSDDYANSDSYEKERFRRWALAKDQGSGFSPFEYAGAMWTCFDASSKTSTYRVVSATSILTPTSLPTSPPSTKPPTYNGIATKVLDTANKSLRERLNYMTPELEAHLSLIERSDWSQAGFGEISDWPAELLEISGMTLMMPKPAAMMVGSRNVMLYNLAYADYLLGPRHPEAMAAPIDDVWPEVITLSFKGIAIRK